MQRIGWLVFMACFTACSGDDDLDGRGGSDCQPGEPAACVCSDGGQGMQVCLPQGGYGNCQCALTRTVPCNAPGATFDCACSDGAAGTEVCLAGGQYSACDCSAAPPVTDVSGPDAGPAEPMLPAGCPAGFSCMDVMGFTVCADSSGFPPFCTSAADCSAAGLVGADCIDPGVGGILVCSAPCSL